MNLSKTEKVLSKREIFKIGLLMFSLFFGAGNLMFPPMLGKESGNNIVFAMFYFSITAIVFPILAIIVVNRFDGLKNMGNKVDKNFGMIFTIVTALAIGPALAVPRAGVLPYEIAFAPYVGGENKLALFIYTTLFFTLVCYFCLTPNKLLDRVSKFLSPMFLILIGLLFLGTIFKGMWTYSTPIPKYETLKGVQGVLDGYMTLDTLAGLIYGFVIAYVINEKGVTNKKKVESIVKKVGVIAGIFLFVVYFIIAHIGGVSVSIFPETKNGLDILRNMSIYFYGNYGFVILSMIFFIACLNISVGVTTSISQYFEELFPRVKYKYWVIVWVLLSYLISNKGLAEIMAYSVPILLCIYPVAVVLIILTLFDEKIKKYNYIYPITIYSTFIISFVGTLDKIKNIKFGIITEIFSKLPLYKLDLEWILVALISVFICIIFNNIFNKNKL